MISRKAAAQLGQETAQILKSGCYISTSGRTVDIGASVARAAEQTRSYPSDDKLLQVYGNYQETCFDVRNETTLETGRRLVGQGYEVAALNFASAKNPGGGFLSGARAQEESLARSSALYACLSGNPMYDFHRALGGPMYTNYVIYSPDVPVIRTDDGVLLDEPWLCSFITAPAVNAKVVLQRDPSRHFEVGEVMRQRIQRILTIATIHGHHTLVLGAWGCGAFGNNTQEIAALFREALIGEFQHAFERVVFAITDWSNEERFIGPFRREFGGPS